jgi:hypothetical protein
LSSGSKGPQNKINSLAKKFYFQIIIFQVHKLIKVSGRKEENLKE